MLSQAMTFMAINGLHARPAAKLAALLKPFKSAVIIQCKDKKANAKSVFELQQLALVKNTPITVFAYGEDQKKALEQTIHFLHHLE